MKFENKLKANEQDNLNKLKKRKDLVCRIKEQANDTLNRAAKRKIDISEKPSKKIEMIPSFFEKQVNHLCGMHAINNLFDL